VGAAAAFDALVADYMRVLGPDHPDTLATRNNLAYWRGQAGDAAVAAAAFEALMADYMRVLGPDHPDTLDARADLAYWRGQAGDAAVAAAAFDALVADYMRVLGPDHPRTLTTRHNLAHFEQRAKLDVLTPQEKAVLEHAAAGHTNLSIARALSISEDTVARYLRSVWAKLGLDRPADLQVASRDESTPTRSA
jgi:DNA-binding NarL/FixJ family response regulator